MTARGMLVALLLLTSGPAAASVDRAALDSVYVDPRPGATLPSALTFQDDADRALALTDAFAGHPGVLVFADYTCHTLCGPILDFTANALRDSGLTPGDDYRLVVVGLDPKDGRAEAHTMRAAHLEDGGPIARTAVFLTGTSHAIGAATAALGYHFAYDAEHDQFAHPAAVFVLNSQGTVTRVLSGLGLSGPDMRLALTEAGQGHVGTLADRFRLLCYGYDPARGIYTARIGFLLQISAAITLAAMAAAALVMHKMTRPAP